MPYKIRKQKCKQSDGDAGSYVLSYTTKKGEKRRACHTSKKKAQGQIAAIEGPWEADEPEEEVTSDTLLREVIRGILTERAGPGKADELIDKMVDINRRLEEFEVPYKVVISLYEDGDSFYVDYAWLSLQEKGPREVYGGAVESYIRSLVPDPERQTAMAIVAHEAPYGGTEFRSSQPDFDDGPCSGAYVVHLTSKTRRGWGPLLYDVAMEIATEKGGGLASDRESVSRHAHGVWRVYDDIRLDVDQQPLDITKSLADQEDLEQLTPNNDMDDCNQESAIEDMGREWFASPLSKVYRKSANALTRLRSEDLLVTSSE